MLRQRDGPARQGLRILKVGQNGPARPRRIVHFGRTQVIGKGCAQRLFIARSYRHTVKQLRARQRFALDHAGKGGHFGAQGVRFAFSLGPRGARFGFTPLGLAAGFLGSVQRLFGFGGKGHGVDLRGFGRLKSVFRGGQRLGCRCDCGARAVGFGFCLLHGRAVVAQQPLNGLMPGRQPRHILGHLGQRGFAL